MADSQFPFEVTIEGAEEVAAAFKHIGETGAEAFSRILEQVSHGEFSGLATMVGGELAGSFTKAAESVGEFVHAQAEAIEKLGNLAEASGTTITKFEGLEAIFASVGISTQGFSRSMGQLAQTVSSSWSSIQQSVSTSADAQEGAHQHVQQAAFNTQKAYTALGNAITSASQTAAHDINDMAGAQLHLERAQLNQLKNLRSQGSALPAGAGGGRGPIDTGESFSAQEKILSQKEDQLAVDKASQAIKDVAIKRAKDSIAVMDELNQKQMDIAKSKLAERETAEKEHQIDLRDIPKIAGTINKLAEGYTTVGEKAKLAEVPSQNLFKGIVLAASKGGARPEAIDVFEKMQSVFQKLGNSSDEMAIKMELVQKAFGAGFRPGLASASQLVAAMSKSKEAVHEVEAEMEKFGTAMNIQGAEADLKKFNEAWNGLGSVLGIVSAHFADILGVAFTPWLESAKKSLEDENGALRAVVNGLSGFIQIVATAASGIAQLVSWLAQATEWFLKLVGHGMGLAAITVIITAIAVAIGGIPLVIALVVTAIGTVIAKWGDIKTAAAAAWDAVIGYIANALAKVDEFISKLTGPLKSAWDVIASIASKVAGGPAAPTPQAAPAGAPAGAWSGGYVRGGRAVRGMADGGGVTFSAQMSIFQGLDLIASTAASIKQGLGGGAAGGGHIRGPGGPTSDTAGLFALSDGEFVVRTAAVQKYGAPFFQALNNMALGGFAMGGLVPHSAAVNTTGASKQASSILNLTIGGEHFDGLQAPEHVASRLKTYAVSRQSTATSRMPTWMR